MAGDERRFHGIVRKQVKARYLRYLPEGYDADTSKKWPLVLFLHGAGERGEDMNLVKLHGPPRRIDEGASFPCVVVAPQCPEDEHWDTDTLAALLEEVASGVRIDPDRITLTGFSMGGLGTWALAAAHPDRFAAIAPICAPALWAAYGELAKLPTWVFHGAMDTAVAVGESVHMVRRLEEAGGEPKLTIYEDLEHDCWTRTYEDEGFWEWLLGHRRPG